MAVAAAKLILAVDLGTSALKVALIGIDGRVAAWESEALTLRVLPGGGAEQDPEDWWRALVAATRRLLARHAGSRDEIVAVCCSTQGEGTVPVGEDGAPLMPCILWMDMRGAPSLHRRFHGPVNVSGLSALKVRRWIRLTGGMPSPTGKDPASHMLLVRDEFPDVYERTYKFLNVLDYLNLRLTGRFVATYDSILTSWVTDNRDPDGIRYDPSLVRDSGIDGDKLPEIVKCTEVLGELTAGAAAELGLAPATKVVAGAIDNTAAAIGSGAVQDFAVHVYIGTSSWAAAHVPFKKTSIRSSLASVPCAVPGRWLMTALQATAGGNLSFLRDNVLYHQDELLAEERVPDVYKIFDRMAAARAGRQQRRALHAVDLGRAGAGRGPLPARRPVQPVAGQHPRGHRARDHGRRRLQHALADAAGLGKFLGRPGRQRQPGRRRRRVGGVVPDLRRRAGLRGAPAGRRDPGQRQGRGLDRGGRPG